MTDELHVHTPDKVARCQVDLHCQAVSKQTIIQLSSHVKEMNVEERTKTKLNQCFKNLTVTVETSKQDEIVHLTELAVYVPSRMTQIFQTVARPYLHPDMLNYSFMTVILMECLEVPDYLTYVDLTYHTNTETDYQYLYPFNMKQVGASASTHNSSRFCQQVLV